MLVGTYFSFWETWLEYHKVRFDGANKLIIVADGVTQLDVKNDIYSSWKEWLVSHENDNAKYLQAMRSVGGDPTVGGERLGATFFLMNGWRMRTWEGDHRISLIGNLYTEEGEPVFVSTVFPHNINIEYQVSNLTSAITVEVPATTPPPEYPTVEEIADAVWSKSMDTSRTPGSFGRRLRELFPSYWGIK